MSARDLDLPRVGGAADRADRFVHLPLAIRRGAVAAAGLRNRLLRYGSCYRKQLRLLAESECWDADRLARLQGQLLERLLAECANETAYYRSVLGHLAAADLREIARHREMTALPLLEKATLRNETRRLLNHRRRPAVWTLTSGTTGSPLTVAHDRESIERSFALLHRHRVWTGAGRWARTVRLSGNQLLPADRRRPPFWLANPAERMLLVSSFHLLPAHAAAIARRIRAFKPQLLEGYPNAIATLGELCPELGGLDSLRAIITTAETLSPGLRERIERSFGVKVFDYYASSEGAPLIQECAAGNLHLRPESGIFEVIGDDGAPLPRGRVGELVVTSFRQWMTPLVRYRTGDAIALAEEEGPCPCGSLLPRAAKILGRQADLVLTDDGRAIAMFDYHVLKHVGDLAQAQIHQLGAREFRVTAVPAGGSDPERLERRLRQAFRRVLGFEPVLHVDLVPELPRGAAGKVRGVIRDWEPGVGPE